jgi:hypothetical protein
MRTVSRVLGLAFLAAVVAAAYNFFTLAPLNEPRAREVVCAGRPKCGAQMVRLFRNPLWTDIDFRVGASTVTVRCGRSAYLVGTYGCSQR